jgi:uncharacterized membrane protein
MAGMTAPHQIALKRLSEEFAAMSQQMARVAGLFAELEHSLAAFAPGAPPVPPEPMQMPMPMPMPAPGPYPYPPAPVAMPTAAASRVPAFPAAAAPRVPVPLAPSAAVAPVPDPRRVEASGRLSARMKTDSGQGWVGKVLAVAGVAVTLVGVVLLLVLAAQAGILRPEIRVAGGAVLAVLLVAVGVRMNGREGGRVGAVALSATGVATAYMDIVAVTAIYHWVPPVVGLLLAAVIGGAGLALARRWDSEQFGLLVLVPLLVLAPIIVDDVSLLLIGFMTVLSAAALPIQLGKDWIWMHAARTAAVTLPLLAALVARSFTVIPEFGTGAWLLGGACAVAALLAIAGALVLLPGASRRVAMALLTVVGVLPALSAGMAVQSRLAALIAALVSAVMLAVVATPRLRPGPGIDDPVTAIWSALSAVAALIAVATAFDGYVEGPVVLAMGLLVAIAGRNSRVARWVATDFAFVGGLMFVGTAGPDTLAQATVLTTPVAISTLASGVLGAMCALVIAWAWSREHDVRADVVRLIWAAAGMAAAYCVTMLTVTAGVLIGGVDGGFLGGHMAATICWIAMAAGLFALALRIGDRDARTAPIAGGLALTAASTAKLFLFDLGTLDGMFRVAAFIVVGLVLLGTGAGYARSLAQQDREHSAN